METFITSVLIPTYNRSKELKQLIRYLATNFNLSLIYFLVLDGSDIEDEKSINRDVCESNKINYRHYGFDTPLQRIFNGINAVKTDTVTLLGDDDILDPKGFSDCVIFLQNNKDYSIAHGRYIGFNYNSNGINYNETYVSQSVEDDSPLKRLFNFLSTYTAPTYYAVNRTKLLKKSFEELIKNELGIRDYVAAEITVSAIPVVNGKLKRLNSFFQARRFLPASDGKYVVYPQYIMEKDFSDKIAKIKKSIIKNIPNPNQATEKTASDAINYSLASFFSQRLSQPEISQRFNALLN